MKALAKLTVLVLLFSLGFSLNARANGDERLNLPGDNLNLYAVMNLFQESETLEAFERSLNAEDSKINNLDLNGNNLIDYIRVIDYPDGDAHTIVLQVAINERENQDVAVITVYKDKNGQVHIQLIGDEYLYGKSYIIEPYYASETPNPGYTGNTRVVTRTTYVEVQSWPVVRYIYTPTYVVWRSPWYWGYYPAYWNPWRPFYWDYYYGYHSHWHSHYYSHYRHCNYYSYPRYTVHYYHNHRSHSSTVRSYRDNGQYNYTYSRPDLRQEGSKDSRRHYASADRPSYRQASTGQGRTKQEVGQSSNNRAEKPVVNNRSANTAARSSAGQDVNRGETRTDNKRENATPAVNNRSSKLTDRSANSQGVSKPASRPDSKSQSAGSAETRTSAKPSARQSSDQGVSRQVSKTDNRSQPAKSSESRTSAKPSVRQSSDKSVSQSSSRQGNAGSSVKASSPSSSRSEARTSAQPQKSNSGAKSNKSGR
jgi:hypothetical protein